MEKLTYEQSSRLFEINRLITQSMDGKEVLRKLVGAAMDLVVRGDTIIIYEMREDGYLHFADGTGIDVTAIKQVKFNPGESIVGRVFKEKRTFVVGSGEAETIMQNMSPENRHHFYNAIRGKEIQSIISVPLLVEGKCLGVLVVDNFNDAGHTFSDEEKTIIEILANQAAIALFNSRFYEELQQRNKDLIKSQEIHNTFTHILLEGKGIEQIVEVLSRILKSRVYYSEVGNDSHAYPIISSHEIVGYFQLKKPFQAFKKLDQVAIEQAAMATVLELTKQNNLFERESHMKEEAFLQLLEGRSIKHASNDIQRKLAVYPSVTCAVLEGRTQPLWRLDSLMAKERFIRNWEKAVRRCHPDSIVFSRGMEIIVLFPTFSEAIYEKFIAIAEKEIDAKWDVIIGIGRSVKPSFIAHTYEEAREALEIARISLTEKYRRYEKLGFERLWHRLDSDVLLKYAQDHLGALLQGEETDLHTLKTYIELNGQHNKTAEQLMIHPNTLNYRLKKIEKELAVNLRNYKDFLTILTALEILDFLPPKLVGSNK